MICNIPRLLLVLAALLLLAARIAVAGYASVEADRVAVPAPVGVDREVETPWVATQATSNQGNKSVQDVLPPRVTQLAIDDLARRLRIRPEEIKVVRVEEVDWPDGSLGCPQPGMRYKQMLVNGTFIQLKVGDNVYNYHGGGARRPFLCKSKNELLPEDLRGAPPHDPRT